MRRRLLLEGADPAALVERARREHGDAPIAGLARLRTGGFLGFFSRETFELAIDVEDPVGRPASTVDQGDAVPFDEVLSQVSGFVVDSAASSRTR